MFLLLTATTILTMVSYLLLGLTVFALFFLFSFSTPSGIGSFLTVQSINRLQFWFAVLYELVMPVVYVYVYVYIVVDIVVVRSKLAS